MKIAYVLQYDEGGTATLARDTADVLREREHIVDIIYTGGPSIPGGGGPIPGDHTLIEYDCTHFWNAPSAQFFPDLAIPCVMTLNHFPHEAWGFYKALRALVDPSIIVVHDRYSQLLLGRYGVLNTRRVPQAFCHDRWPVLPPPRDFVVGFLGANSDHLKRLPVPVMAAAALKLPSYGWDCSDQWERFEGVLDLYRKTSVFVVASFHDSGPLPPQEALLCGRPVVSTHVGMMDDIIRPGGNGEFYDGSVEGCMSALQRVLSDYTNYREGALATRSFLPRLTNVADTYISIYKEALCASASSL